MSLADTIAFKVDKVKKWNLQLFHKSHGAVLFLSDYYPLDYPAGNEPLCFTAAILNLYRLFFDDKCLEQFVKNTQTAGKQHISLLRAISSCRSWFCHNNGSSNERTNDNRRVLLNMRGHEEWAKGEWDSACEQLEKMVREEETWLDTCIGNINQAGGWKLEDIEVAVRRYHFTCPDNPASLNSLPKGLLYVVRNNLLAYSDRRRLNGNAYKKMEEWLCSPLMSGNAMSGGNFILQEMYIQKALSSMHDPCDYPCQVIAKCFRMCLSEADDFRDSFNDLVSQL